MNTEFGTIGVEKKKEKEYTPLPIALIALFAYALILPSLWLAAYDLGLLTKPSVGFLVGCVLTMIWAGLIKCPDRSS